MITFNEVCFAYKKNKNVLEDISFDIERNKIYGLLGHNGAGKTTIFRLITGIIKCNKGKIDFCKDVFENYRVNISYMPESNSIYEKLTARENIFFRGKLCNLSNSEIQVKTEKVLKELGLYKRSDEKTGYLSNGLKKRVSMACALVSNPKLILLDEPTNAVDPESVEIIIGLLMELKRKGVTVLLSTHDLNVVTRVCSDIVLINNGNAAYAGALENIPMNLKDYYLSITAEKCNAAED